ncbi:MAG: HTH-type transcriptional regulator CymR [Firmicutes bacterium ADurb.Bin193]|nr:MAG: HTH-type transcriptional regulator CymR [Firmicutes bacterium ADurb.Bin193]
MRISAKGRYGLAAMIYLASGFEGQRFITVTSISEELDISKIYLEQVFSSFKKAGLVESAKGAGGGYRLLLPPDKVTVYDILSATEQTLFEKAKEFPGSRAKNIDRAIRETVVEAVDRAVADKLKSVTVYDLASAAEKYGTQDNIMFYI